MVIGLPGAFEPRVLSASAYAEPGNEPPLGQAGKTANGLDKVDDLITDIRFDPVPGQASPCKLFFKAIFSDTSSVIRESRSLSFLSSFLIFWKKRFLVDFG